MKIDFPKVIELVDLREYAPQFEVNLEVWVNPPRKLLEDYAKAIDNPDKSKDVLFPILVELWSQGSESSRWTVEELEGFVNRLADTDPALFAWMIVKTNERIGNHRTGRKKK